MTEDTVPGQNGNREPSRDEVLGSMADDAIAYGISPDELAQVIAARQSQDVTPTVDEVPQQSIEEPELVPSEEPTIALEGRRDGETDSDYLERYTDFVVSGITRARHGVYQSHDLVSERTDSGRIISSKRNEPKSMEEDDLVEPTNRRPSHSGAVVDALQDLFNIPPVSTHLERRGEVGTLLVVGAARNGRYIIQGGGLLARDLSSQPVYAGFKVVFNNTASYNLFADWLESKPSLALKSVLGVVMRGESIDGEDYAGGIDQANPDGFSYGRMAMAIAPKQGKFAFFDGPVTGQPVEPFTKVY